MNFSDALTALKQGKRITQTAWNGKGMWLALQEPDTNSKMSLPYIYMCTVTGDLVPWLASQSDLLSNTWEIL